MDRYVLVVFLGKSEVNTGDLTGLELVRQVYVDLKCLPGEESSRPTFPACSLNGSPSGQRWYFALQTCQGATQFCSTDWEDVGTDQQTHEHEEEKQTAVEACFSSLINEQAQEQLSDLPTVAELLEEAAEGVHLLSDKLPPPGKALLDVLVLGHAEQPPAFKDLLPLLGALKHMVCWHAAKISVVTLHDNGWHKVASYLTANLVKTDDLNSCIDHRELWRGSVLIKEKKNLSELRFEGFSLRSAAHNATALGLLQSAFASGEHSSHSEVFHYYRPVVDLIQFITLSDLPSILMSSNEIELGLSGKSKKAKLLLDQLMSLRGEVGALLSLSCIITPVSQLPANQLSSQRWRESVTRAPKSLTVPDVEVKGESAHYLLLVQGSENIGSGVCRVRILNSASQINGAAAMATVIGLRRERPTSSSGGPVGSIFHNLPCLRAEDFLKKEQIVAQAQMLALKDILWQKQKETTATIPVNTVKALLRLTRERCAKMSESNPSLETCLLSKNEDGAANIPDLFSCSSQQSDWPERSVLHNIENLQKRQQRSRFGLLGPGSSDSLLGPKDNQKGPMASLDARELLKHFTSDGEPTGDLQPLAVQRGVGVAYQLTSDLSPRKASQVPFSKAVTFRFHGIEFCLDNQKSLDRDQAFVKLQSRLIRYETQTTCSKEPCALPFALSPAPSPAVMSEPGSVPDGEMLQNADVARLKRRSWDTDVGGYPSKRLAKSESSDSLCSQSSNSSGTHPSLRSLRQQTHRSQSLSSSSISSAAMGRMPSGLVNLPPEEKPIPPQQKSLVEGKSAKESRSQKHNRMLQEIVTKTLKHRGITAEHQCFEACNKRLFDISKFYLKDLKTSRGLQDEMKKAATSNVKQVIEWVLEKTSKK